jgi:hypothetical protein
MQETNNGGLSLAVGIFLGILLLFVLVNWGSSFQVLYESEATKRPFRESLSAILNRLKITILQFCGASRGDLRDNAMRYLEASRLKETYLFINKARCLWQLFSYYMFYTLVLVYLAKPINMSASLAEGKLTAFSVGKNALQQILNLTVLSATNVVTDFLSLAITFVLLGKVINSLNTRRYTNVVLYAAIDLTCAFLLFVCSQLVSNILYPLAITNPPANYNPFSIDAALMPYAFLKGVEGPTVTYFNFTFPGQLFITGTVFIPTLVSMGLVTSFSIILLIGEYVKKAQSALLGIDGLSQSLGPEPLVGPYQTPQMRRAAHCFDLAAHAMLAVFTSTISGIIVVIFTRLFLQAS